MSLTGSVALYSAKEDADRKAHHRKGVRAVENNIQVGGHGERTWTTRLSATS